MPSFGASAAVPVQEPLASSWQPHATGDVTTAACMQILCAAVPANCLPACAQLQTLLGACACKAFVAERYICLQRCISRNAGKELAATGTTGHNTSGLGADSLHPGCRWCEPQCLWRPVAPAARAAAALGICRQCICDREIRACKGALAGMQARSLLPQAPQATTPAAWVQTVCTQAADVVSRSACGSQLFACCPPERTAGQAAPLLAMYA